VLGCENAFHAYFNAFHAYFNLYAAYTVCKRMLVRVRVYVRTRVYAEYLSWV